jgi:hypothetical protein
MRVVSSILFLATAAQAATTALAFAAANNGTCNLAAEEPNREPLWLADDWPAYECSCSCAKVACREVFVFDPPPSY